MWRRCRPIGDNIHNALRRPALIASPSFVGYPAQVQARTCGLVIHLLFGGTPTDTLRAAVNACGANGRLRNTEVLKDRWPAGCCRCEAEVIAMGIGLVARALAGVCPNLFPTSRLACADTSVDSSAIMIFAHGVWGSAFVHGPSVGDTLFTGRERIASFAL